MRGTLASQCHGGVAVSGAELPLDEHDRLVGGDVELVEEAPGAAAESLPAEAHLTLGIGPGRAGDNEGMRRRARLIKADEAAT